MNNKEMKSTEFKTVVTFEGKQGVCLCVCVYIHIHTCIYQQVYKGIYEIHRYMSYYLFCYVCHIANKKEGTNSKEK